MDLVDFDGFFDRVSFTGEAVKVEELVKNCVVMVTGRTMKDSQVSGKCVQNVDTIHHVPLTDWDVHGNYFVFVGFMDLHGRLEYVEKVGELVISERKKIAEICHNFNKLGF